MDKKTKEKKLRFYIYGNIINLHFNCAWNILNIYCGGLLKILKSTDLFFITF